MGVGPSSPNNPRHAKLELAYDRKLEAGIYGRLHCIEAKGITVGSKRVDLIRDLLSEAEGYLAKGDAAQSSEKLYKATEECIKSLAELSNLEEVKAAEDKGRWTVTLLEKAVGKLADKLGTDVELGWDAANYLHIWGFHELKLDVEDVRRRMPIIRRLLELSERTR